MIGSVLLWLTQPMLILTSLGAFVVILHALLVYAHPLSDEGWRRVDCIWLAGAVLSLLGMSAEARRQWVKLRKPISEQLHLGSVDYLRDSFLVLVQPVGVPLLHQVLADRLVGHRKDGVAHGAGGVLQGRRGDAEQDARLAVDLAAPTGSRSRPVAAAA